MNYFCLVSDICETIKVSYYCFASYRNNSLPRTPREDALTDFIPWVRTHAETIRVGALSEGRTF